jgi:hypothetical protein
LSDIEEAFESFQLGGGARHLISRLEETAAREVVSLMEKQPAAEDHGGSQRLGPSAAGGGEALLKDYESRSEAMIDAETSTHAHLAVEASAQLSDLQPERSEDRNSNFLIGKFF